MKPTDINYNILPEHIREGAQRYIEKGILPGDFMRVVIRNNLMESFRCADDINAARMLDIVRFWYKEAPMDCWGSEERMIQWHERGGLTQYKREKA